MSASALVASTTEAAFSIDANARISAWNEGAEQLFGYTAVQMQGQRCWDVLTSYDRFGNQYCIEGCPLIRMAKAHRPVNRCELCFETAGNKCIDVSVATFASRTNDNFELEIVHFFTPVKRRETQSKCQILTKREADVFRLLSDCKDTKEIGEMLSVSEATVRNHIQRVLRKLRVHSRLAAVCKARQLGLLDGADIPDE